MYYIEINHDFKEEISQNRKSFATKRMAVFDANAEICHTVLLQILSVRWLHQVRKKNLT